MTVNLYANSLYSGFGQSSSGYQSYRRPLDATQLQQLIDRSLSNTNSSPNAQLQSLIQSLRRTGDPALQQLADQASADGPFAGSGATDAESATSALNGLLSALRGEQSERGDRSGYPGYGDAYGAGQGGQGSQGGCRDGISYASRSALGYGTGFYDGYGAGYQQSDVMGALFGSPSGLGYNAGYTNGYRRGYGEGWQDAYGSGFGYGNDCGNGLQNIAQAGAALTGDPLLALLGSF